MRISVNIVCYVILIMFGFQIQSNAQNSIHKISLNTPKDFILKKKMVYATPISIQNIQFTSAYHVNLKYIEQREFYKKNHKNCYLRFYLHEYKDSISANQVYNNINISITQSAYGSFEPLGKDYSFIIVIKNYCIVLKGSCILTKKEFSNIATQVKMDLIKQLNEKAKIISSECGGA